MKERIVVLRAKDGMSFVVEACAVLAEAVNEVSPARNADANLITVYAEMVRAYARLVRPRLVAQGEAVRVALIDHLLGRLAEAQAGVRAVPVVDVVDRVHGELVRVDAFALI